MAKAVMILNVSKQPARKWYILFIYFRVIVQHQNKELPTAKKHRPRPGEKLSGRHPPEDGKKNLVYHGA